MATHLHTCKKCAQPYECSMDIGSCPEFKICFACTPKMKMAATGKPYCKAISPDGNWSCTLEKGHEGPEHIGHSTPDKIVGRWPIDRNVTCHRCDSPVDEHGRNCSRCGSIVCADCTYRCKCCDVYLCTGCSERHGVIQD